MTDVIDLLMFQRAPCTSLQPWIPLLAASVNPEETPFFRKELTGETHKAEEEKVREDRSGRRNGKVKEEEEDI